MRKSYLISSYPAMGGFSVFTGAVQLLASPLYSHRPPYPQTDSFGAAPFPYSISTISCFVIGESPIWAINSTNYKNENTGAGLSYCTQAETASGVCPFNLRISAGSSSIKSAK
jgi:hypothetical protein